VARDATFRIGAGSGFAGDRLDPAVDLAERGELDALVFECLAERTIALAQSRRLRSQGPGFDTRIVERVEATVDALQRRRAPIITNAGAADPEGAAHAVVNRLRPRGSVTNRSVAAVTGDDVLSVLDLRASRVWGSDKTLWDYRDRIVSANAYLGMSGIVTALDSAPAVIITGRVADAALFLAPLVHHFGWSPDDYPEIAAGTAVGHLLECAGQLTGGYFADGERKEVPGLARLGFPFADVSSDGAATFAKLAGTGGRLDRATAIEQLLYEVNDPSAYLTPDITLDLSTILIEEPDEPDTVRIQGAQGRPAPSTLKVTVGVADGHVCRAEISYAGDGCVTRAELAAEVVIERWREVHGLEGLPLTMHMVGVNACRPFYHPAGEPAEVRLVFSVRATEADVANTLAREVEALYTNGPAGGGGVAVRLQETVGTLSTTIPRDQVGVRVKVVS
jgi:hypothetical protein